MLHFPTLCRQISSPDQIKVLMTDFITRLKENFAVRVGQPVLPTEVMAFARDSFIVASEGGIPARAKGALPTIDEGKFILKLVDMQSTVTMPQELCTKGPAQFWSDVNVHQFPSVKKAAVMVLSMFGSTYTFESSFSHMNAMGLYFDISFCIP